jgi:hypothetical protein
MTCFAASRASFAQHIGGHIEPGLLACTHVNCQFDDTIVLADGQKLVTLRDAANHITGLPKKESQLPEWQNAIEALMLVADLGGPATSTRKPAWC